MEVKAMRLYATNPEAKRIIDTTGRGTSSWGTWDTGCLSPENMVKNEQEIVSGSFFGLGVRHL